MTSYEIPAGRPEERFTEKHPLTLVCMANLARVNMFLGRLEESERLFEHAVELNREVNGDDHRGTLITMIYLAQLYRRMGRMGEAESMYLQVNELARNRYGDTFPSTLASADGLAKLYIRMDRAAECEPLAAAAAAGARQAYGATTARTGLYLRTWGRCLGQVGRFEEAEPVLLESYEILDASGGPEHTDTVEVIEALVELYDDWGRPGPANDWRAKLLVEQPSFHLGTPLVGNFFSIFSAG